MGGFDRSTSLGGACSSSPGGRDLGQGDRRPLPRRWKAGQNPCASHRAVDRSAVTGCSTNHRRPNNPVENVGSDRSSSPRCCHFLGMGLCRCRVARGLGFDQRVRAGQLVSSFQGWVPGNAMASAGWLRTDRIRPYRQLCPKARMNSAKSEVFTVPFWSRSAAQPVQALPKALMKMAKSEVFTRPSRFRSPRNTRTGVP